ncbi:hypothetical protein GCM10027440_14390 [Nocardiopsis coralliicola]
MALMQNDTGTPPHKRRPHRAAVPITEDLREFVRAARRTGSPERAALVRAEAAPPGGELSEAATLSSLVELGRRAVAEELLDAEYAAIAGEQDEEDRAVHAALRARRRMSPEAAERLRSADGSTGSASTASAGSPS